MHENKIPLKQAEVSVHRFNDMAIPYQLGLLNNHRINIEKSLAVGDWNKIRKEEINAMRVIKQIKNLLLEMDALRSKVLETDQAQFDAMLEIGKQKAFAGMKHYMELQLKSPSRELFTRANSNTVYNDEDNEQNEENICNSLRIVSIDETSAHQATLPDIKADFKQTQYELAQRQACLDDLEMLQQEIRDLNGMFHNMSELVHEQAQSVEIIAENAEEALENVQAAENQLRRALRYKKAIYPVLGAVVGTCVGGPLGLVVGIKAAGWAAVGCGILGYTGASVLKSNPDITQGSIIEEHEQQIDELQNTANTPDITHNTE